MSGPEAHAPSPPLACFEGENGVSVEVRDESARYGYANIFRVRLRVVARVAGDPEPYERTLERQGVHDSDLERARTELLEAFRLHTLPYLLRPDFPRGWTAHRTRARRRVIPFPAGR